MHRVDAQRLQRLDFAEGARGTEFDHALRTGAGQHDERGQERAKFTHHDRDHDRAEKLGGADARDDRDHLPNDNQAESRRDEQDHGQQTQTRAGELGADEWMNDVGSETELSDHDPERDERKRPESLHGEDEQ